jgi:hypothetical protein
MIFDRLSRKSEIELGLGPSQIKVNSKPTSERNANCSPSINKITLIAHPLLFNFVA